MKNLKKIIFLFFLLGVLFSCEEEKQPPTCKINLVNGNVFTRGEEIYFLVQASGGDGELYGVRIFINGDLVEQYYSEDEPGSGITINYNWMTKNANIGELEIRALAVNHNYLEAEDFAYVAINNRDLTSSTLKDTRDGRNYRTIKIGSQWWMAENLAYLPKVNLPSNYSSKEPLYYVNGYSGNNLNAAKTNSNYTKYGVLYNWLAANEACPDGWHLPSDTDWEQLAQFISDQKGPYTKIDNDWHEVGRHLKTTGTIEDGDGLWFKEYISAEGTDLFGFSGLPGESYHRKFYVPGKYGVWWKSSIEKYGYARNVVLSYDDSRFRLRYSNKERGLSVRCVKD